MVLTIRLCSHKFKLLPKHIDWTDRFDGSVSKLQKEVESKNIVVPPGGVYIRSKSKSDRDGVSVYYRVTITQEPAEIACEPRKIFGSWYQLFDEQSQRFYFANIDTRKTQWERPTDPANFNESDNGTPSSKRISSASESIPSSALAISSRRHAVSRASNLSACVAKLTPVERELQQQILDLQRQVRVLKVHFKRFAGHVDTAPKRAKPKPANLLESVENKIKAAVSKKKRRLQEDSFDLDLSYILGNVISMGYPATGVEGIYRNRITEVKKFLDQRHKGHYRLYNLCAERMYDHSLFEGRVNHQFRFIDHHPPPMKHFAPFVASVTQWLAADSKNVAVVHCKAGKGRTGTIIAAYLCFSNDMSAEEALDLFGRQRTQDGKGVTIPSQRRFVEYFSRLCKMQWSHLRANRSRVKSIQGLDASLLVMRHLAVRLTSIEMSSIPNIENGCKPYFEIHSDFSENYWRGSKKKTECRILTSSKPLGFKSVFRKREPGAKISYDLEAQKLLLEGEVKIIFKHKAVIGSKKMKMFHLWLHTAFINEEELVLTKKQLDGPHKDKKGKFDKDFKLTLRFDLSIRRSNRPGSFSSSADPFSPSASAAASAAASASAAPINSTPPIPTLPPGASKAVNIPLKPAALSMDAVGNKHKKSTKPVREPSPPPPPSPPSSMSDTSDSSSDSSESDSDSDSDSSSSQSEPEPVSPSPVYESASSAGSASPPDLPNVPAPPPTPPVKGTKRQRRTKKNVAYQL